jgi:outer membrane lipoprotein-sorting protein
MAKNRWPDCVRFRRYSWQSPLTLTVESRMASFRRSGISLRHASLGLVLAALTTVTGCKREDAETVVAPTAAATATDAPAALAKAAEAVQPLPSAKDQVGGVMDRFLAATSYHATMTARAAKGDMTMEMDFVAPDRYRMKMPMGTQYVIGDTMYMTMNGRTMKTPLPKGQLGEYRDPAKFAEHKATMTVEDLGSEAVDGQAATKYLVRNTQPKAGESTMWVGADGYPLKIEVSGDAGGQVTRTTIRYSRFNDPTIKVEPPQ